MLQEKNPLIYFQAHDTEKLSSHFWVELGLDAKAFFFPGEYGILVHSNRMVQPYGFTQEVEIFSLLYFCT